MTKLAALLFLVSTSLDLQTKSAGWPHWRGPRRDGISLENDWSSVGASEPVWRAEVGPGYSNVAIVGGRLYTLGHDVERAEDRLVCLDIETGREHWSFGWPEELADTFHGGGANSTPTVHEGTVYVLGRSGQALAFEAVQGTLRWRHDYLAELELAKATYGFAASPVLEGVDLFLTLGGTTLGVDPADGAVRWRVDVGGRGGYATPVPFERAGTRYLTNFASDALVVQRADGGEVVHRFGFKGEGGSLHACTPIVVGDDVFLSGAFGAGAARVRLGDALEPEVVWSTRALRNKVSGCTLLDGFVYGFDESMLKCLDFATGEERWRVRGLGMGSVAVAGDRLLVLDSDGELIVARASPEGFEELSRRPVLEGGVYWTTPVLLEGRIYARNSLGSLVCLDHRKARGTGSTEPVAEGPETSVPSWQTLLATHDARAGTSEHDSVRLVGTYECVGAGVPRTVATLDLTADGRWRLEWDLSEFGLARRVCDGEAAWQEDPFYGTFLFEDDARREALETGGLRGALASLERATERRVSGPERFGEHDCWRVELSGSGGASRALFFDAASGRLAGRSAPSEAMVRLDDWRVFGDVELPARTTWLMPDTGAEEVFRVESASWDAVDAALFARPAWVRRELRTPEQVAADGERLRQTFAALLGRYGAEHGITRTFAVHEGALALMGDGEPDFVLEPDDEGRFFLETPPEACVVIERDASGRGAVMRLESVPGAEPTVLARLPD